MFSAAQLPNVTLYADWNVDVSITPNCLFTGAPPSGPIVLVVFLSIPGANFTQRVRTTLAEPLVWAVTVTDVAFSPPLFSAQSPQAWLWFSVGWSRVAVSSLSAHPPSSMPSTSCVYHVVNGTTALNASVVVAWPAGGSWTISSWSPPGCYANTVNIAGAVSSGTFLVLNASLYVPSFVDPLQALSWPSVVTLESMWQYGSTLLSQNTTLTLPVTLPTLVGRVASYLGAIREAILVMFHPGHMCRLRS